MSISITDLEVGQQLASTTVDVNRADLVRYAGASGDFNPIHYSDRFAESVGLPGVIAHGMFTMGAAIQLVTEWIGDPAAILDYQTRFAGMVPVSDPADAAPAEAVGATLSVVATVGKLDAEAGTVRVDLAVSLGSEKVLGKAQAIVKVEAA